jgi:hypothetical protein
MGAGLGEPTHNNVTYISIRIFGLYK